MDGKGHVQNPMQAIFNAPMLTHRPQKLLGVGGQAGKEITALYRCPTCYRALALHFCYASQTCP